VSFLQTRRTFLQTLIAAGVGAALDPEQLLWVPGRRTYLDLHLPRTTIGYALGIDDDTIGLQMLKNQILRIENEIMRVCGVGPGRVLLIERPERGRDLRLYAPRWEDVWRSPDPTSHGLAV
jgi:hypothetical protein